MDRPALDALFAPHGPCLATRPASGGRRAWAVGARAAAAVALGLALLLAGGCASLGLGGAKVTSGPTFPDGVEQSKVLDIHVLRSGTSITLTNTTGRAFGRVLLWANRWYGLEIESFGVGQTLTLDLASFTDRYGQPFRAGGFFATESTDPLVQVQVQEGQELIGLVVVGSRY